MEEVVATVAKLSRIGLSRLRLKGCACNYIWFKHSTIFKRKDIDWQVFDLISIYYTLFGWHFLFVCSAKGISLILFFYHIGHLAVKLGKCLSIDLPWVILSLTKPSKMLHIHHRIFRE